MVPLYYITLVPYIGLKSNWGGEIIYIIKQLKPPATSASN